MANIKDLVVSPSYFNLPALINQKENFLILNHLPFIFRFYTYNSRSSGKLNIEFQKLLHTKLETSS